MDGADSPPIVETVAFTPLKVQRGQAIATISREARDCSVEIESIDEQPRTFVTDLRVQVRGAPSEIDSFCARTRGRREDEATGSKLRRFLGAVWEAVSWNPPF